MEDFLNIDFERSGGFTGLPVKIILNNKLLSSAESAEIEDLIEKSGFFDLQLASISEKLYPDRFFYTIVIETTDRRHIIRLGEQQVPDSLRPLIKYLLKRAGLRKQ